MEDEEDTQAGFPSRQVPLPKKGREQKHVTFPPDEDMVLGIHQHQEPLRPGDDIALTEVISAYKRSCVKYHVEPKSKILEQLQQGAPTQGHCVRLDLQGEQLDCHSCESLEDILKLVRFDIISLRETELDENGASSLFDMILYYESTTHLDISSNASIGILGWKALSNLTQQSGHLESLDASDMPLLERPARLLSGALRYSRLSVLHLNNSSLSGRPLFTLVGILKMNTALRELYLANNKLNSFQDSMQLGELLKHNQSLQCLDLSNNLLSDPGLEEICEGLRAQRSRLRTLILWGNNITEQGVAHLAGVLPLVKTLETLNLGNNSLQNQGVHTLKESLILNHSLLQLSLACTGITCQGVVALAEFIAESRRIQQLDICNNRVGTGGLLALSRVLKFNRTLVRVELDREPEEEQDDFLIETQKSLLHIIYSHCQENATSSCIESDLGLEILPLSLDSPLPSPETDRPHLSSSAEPQTHHPGLSNPDEPQTHCPGVTNTDEPQTQHPGLTNTDEPQNQYPGVTNTDEPDTHHPGLNSPDEPQTQHPDLTNPNEPADQPPQSHTLGNISDTHPRLQEHSTNYPSHMTKVGPLTT